MELLFWCSLGWVVYVYAGYPVLAALLRGIVNRPIRRDTSLEPRVSILIAAFNEAKVIEQTLRNKLDLDYPMDKLEILVVSDESTDGTDEKVLELARSAPCTIRLARQ